jgi:hypothetical protein
VLETSHPPTYYIPPEDVRMDILVRSKQASFCEWKGSADYWTVRVGGREAMNAAWSYPDPERPFEALKDHLAFYCGAVDACRVDGEEVQPQPGGFYGGWVTRDVVGPFKGEPGSWGWWVSIDRPLPPKIWMASPATRTAAYVHQLKHS